jgi:hypothetical protein
MCADSQKIKETCFDPDPQFSKTPKIQSISSTPGSFRKPTAL